MYRYRPPNTIDWQGRGTDVDALLAHVVDAGIVRCGVSTCDGNHFVR
jgi:hypothetical protein